MDTLFNKPVSPVAEQAPPKSLLEIAKVIFLAWEKLRIGYLAILILITLVPSLLAPRELWYSVRFWIRLAEGAVLANICYFAGPIIETYWTWLGFRGSWLRIVLFIVGTLFACLLAFGVMATLLLHGMDHLN